MLPRVEFPIEFSRARERFVILRRGLPSFAHPRGIHFRLFSATGSYRRPGTHLPAPPTAEQAKPRLSRLVVRLRFPIPALSTLSDGSIATRRFRKVGKFGTRDVFGRIATTSGNDFQAASITIRKEVAVVAYAREEHSRSERAISLPRGEASRQKVPRFHGVSPRTGLSSRGTSPYPTFHVLLVLSRRHRASKSNLRSLSPRRVLSPCFSRFEDYPSTMIKIVAKSERLCRSILRRQLRTEIRIPYLAF